VGYLPLALVSSRLFGRFLVGLPYLNSGGVVAENDQAAVSLIDRAVQLADELDVRYLELRHERRYEHPALAHEVASKVHMRLRLPETANKLWNQLKAKVRNQVRKGREFNLAVRWGGEDLLPDFYDVFSRNMRDLGTPVYGRSLFRAIIGRLPEQAEFCVVRDGTRPVAAALLVHGQGVTEVPSASSLRQFSSTNANMLMYWHLFERAIERGQQTFDFGRSTIDSNTFRFKKQWGAEPHPAVWQYYVRRGTVGDMRPESSRYRHFIRIWQRLPVALTRLVGPTIVRGIP
jgi:FemAB-related protein (PEP-CTERM system-associated)